MIAPITEAISHMLESLEGELQDKAINVTKLTKDMESASAAMKDAEVQMAKRRKAWKHVPKGSRII
ncbi:MAG: siphovirus Gp157 family protein [Methylococcaceae bacterium]